MSKPGCRFIVEREYHAAVAQFLTAYGISELAARVLALIYLAHAPQINITANDMVRILGLSRATVGNALAELEAGGLVLRNTEPGSKRACYRTYSDAWEFYQAVLQQRRLREVDQSLLLLRQALRQERAAKAKEDLPARRARAFMDTAAHIRHWMETVTELTRDELERYFAMTPQQIRKSLRST